MNTHNMLIISDTDMYVQDSDGQILLETKPTLSFEYKEIRYYIGEQLYSINGTDFVGLNTEQQSEIEQFISSKRAEAGILKLAVDSDGKYLGRIKESDPKVAAIVDMAPPNLESNWRWNFELNKWMQKYFYDAEGNLVLETSDKKVGSTFVPHPNKPFYRFDTLSQSWFLEVTSSEFQKYKTFLENKLCGIYFTKLIDKKGALAVYTKLKELDDNQFENQVIMSSFEELDAATTIGQLEATIELASELIATSTTINA